MSRRIKVCQVHNRYSVGGAEMVALEIARGLDPERFESSVLAVTEPAGPSPADMEHRFLDAGIPTHALRREGYRDPRTLWGLFRFLRQHRPDIIHGHQRFSDYWACRVGRWAGVPHGIWTRHSVYRDMSPRQIARYQRIAAHAPVVLAVSGAVGRNCVEFEGLPAEKIRVEVNGIDTERFRPLPPALRAEVREGLGLGADELMVLFVGRLSPEKAPEAFPALVAGLKERGLPVRGFMCGRGVREDAVREAATGTPVTLLGLRTDIPQLLAECDLLVSTSRIEGLPLNIMEAMSSGRPFVGPDLDQVLELVSDDPDLAAGVYPQPPAEGDLPRELLQRWVEAAAARLADPDGCARAGERGREVIIRDFSLGRMVAAHEAVYENLMAVYENLMNR